MLKVKTFTFNAFQENTFVLYNDNSKNAYIIDPGCSEEHEIETLDTFFKANQLTPVKIVNTHCHIDHVLGVDPLKTKYNIEFYAHADEELLLNRAAEQAAMFGLKLNSTPILDNKIDETTDISLDGATIRLLHAPGHSMGSLAIYCPEEKFAICGDVIFMGSIGRTDLVGGNFDTLIDSIKTKILTLPDDTTICPGHGPVTTVAREKKTNPFLQNI